MLKNPLRRGFIGLLRLFLILILLPLILPARQPGITFDSISTEEGLSQVAVSCILQDFRGFMWFGTQDGLNRYDGYHFDIYKHDPLNPSTLSDSYILCVLEDRDNTLWIGTYTGGLNKFDREKEVFSNYRYNPDDPLSISSDHIQCLFESPVEPGVLWIGTRSGLNKFSVEKEQCTRYIHDPGKQTGLSDNRVQAIFATPAAPNVLWIGTENGLNRFDSETGRFTHYFFDAGKKGTLSNNIIYSIYEDSSGRMWIGTNGGLNLFDREKETFTPFVFHPGSPKSLSNDRIRAIYESPAEPGILWVGTFGGGLNRFDPGKKEFAHWTYEPGSSGSINDDFISCLYEDRSGATWIGSSRGLNRLDRYRKKFIHYSHNPNDPGSLSSSDVRAILEDRDGTLWIGAYGGGLNRFRREQGQFTHYRHIPGSSASLSSDSVRVIYEDRERALWIGTLDGGLNRFDRKTGKFKHYRYNPTDPYSLGNDYVRAIIEDKKGNLWIGTYDGGLNRFDRKKESFKRYKYDPRKPGSLSHNRVLVLFEDRRGELWVGTSGGLNRFRRRRENFTAYRNRPRDLYSLGNNVVMSIYEDRAGNFWVGTYGGGLNRLDRDSGLFTRFTEKDGLPNDVIYSILEDEKGHLWLSTNKGISHFNPEKISFKNYDTGDGLQHNEFNAGAYFKSKSGEMFFGGVNGFNAFFPSRIQSNPHAPAVVISKFNLFNKPVSIGAKIAGRVVLTKSITETRAITLTHRHTFFSLEYAALHYANPAKNRCAYKMEGLEKEWNYVGQRRFANYTTLPPGEYVFRVKGANNDGTWNEAGVSLAIEVLPVFWQTWWFLLLCVLAAVFFGVSLFRLRVKQLKKRKKELEHLINLRTDQLTQANKEMEKLSIVARETDSAVMIIDADGNFEWVNEGFTRTFGWTLEQLIAERGRSLLSSSANPNIKDVIRTCVEEKKTVTYQSTDRPQPDRKIWTQTTLTPILDQAGKVTKLVAIDSDITRIKETEERIKEQNKAILKQSRELKKAYEIARKEREAAEVANRAKSMFLARMSHEIRTPLNGVIGFSDLMLETELNEEQTDYIKTITRSGEALLALIEDILDISRIEAGKLTFEDSDFDPEILAFDVCNMIYPRIGGKRIEVLCRIGDHVPAFIRSDPGRMRQVLVNLMNNAVKFTAEGEVELSLDVAEEKDNRLKFHASVRDTGDGIPKDKQETIFETFQQIDESYSRRYGGAGLGLSICRQIARLLQGDVWVESEEGKGSIFHFTAYVKKSARKPQVRPDIQTLSGKRALIVDDNPTNISILSQFLHRAGMTTVELLESRQVLPALLKSIEAGKPVDICILDIHMPDMSGYELAEQLRAYPDSRVSKLPLLAFTSSAAMQAKLFRESGFSGFLPKPIQRYKLLAMVERLLRFDSEEIEEAVKTGRVLTRHTLREEAKHSIRILVVEDNIVNQKLVDHILTRAGYRINIVNNGREAVDEVAKNPAKYDLVFMDINMPEMDGREATRRIREQGHTDLPILAMTAYAMKEDREEFLRAGMDDYIPKPMKREMVYRMVDKWVLKRMER